MLDEQKFKNRTPRDETTLKHKHLFNTHCMVSKKRDRIKKTILTIYSGNLMDHFSKPALLHVVLLGICWKIEANKFNLIVTTDYYFNH